METTRDEDVGARVGENFEELRSAVGDRVHEIRDTIDHYVDEHPLASIGIAFGVGYLLSGALFSRTTLKVATLGGRFAVGGVLKQLLAGIGPGMILAALGGERGREGGSVEAAAPRAGDKGKGNGGDRS
jgi:hypothetical protein